MEVEANTVQAAVFVDDEILGRYVHNNTTTS